MNYYPLHIGDMRSGTVNMSRQMRWIYRDMVDVYYDTEKPLPAELDVLCDMLGVESPEEIRIVERLLRFKFTQSEDGYHHARCDREIAAYHAKADVAKANGKRGGRPPKADRNQKEPSGFQAGSDVDATANPVACGSQTNQEPITNNQYKEPPNPRKRGNAFDASAIDLPDWLNETDWHDWVKDRKDRRKPITEQGAKKQIAQLDAYRRQGHSPHEVIANSIAGGYTGLFPGSHRLAGAAGAANGKFDPLAHVNRNRTKPSPGGYDDGIVDV